MYRITLTHQIGPVIRYWITDLGDDYGNAVFRTLPTAAGVGVRVENWTHSGWREVVSIHGEPKDAKISRGAVEIAGKILGLHE